jgi:RHS repeat-associated protein
MTPNGTAAETAEYYHPDRLGTRVVSNPATGGFYEQVTLPFGTALASESTGATNRRFTSYDRNQTTGLDYAMNRNYDPQQGRFTQVDPLGMQSVTLEAPQTLNLYSYCGNDPINHTDPDGLFWGAIGRFFKKLGKFLSAIGQAIGKILNNRWVRIGVFIAGFLIPGLNILSEALAHAVSIALKAYNYIADIGALLEMSGQLLTGRFKELVITLGFAFLSAAISPLVEGAVSGAQNALFGGKFDELWDVFKGIGKGLADSWKDFTHNLLGRGLMGMIPGLDKFAGPDVPSDERLEDYRDFDNGLDGNQDGYKEHDFGLSNLKEIVNQTKNELIALGIDPKTAAWAVRRSYNIARGQMHARLVGRLITSAPRIRLTDIAFAGRPGVGSVFKFLALHYFSGAAVFRRFVR